MSGCGNSIPDIPPHYLSQLRNFAWHLVSKGRALTSEALALDNTADLVLEQNFFRVCLTWQKKCVQIPPDEAAFTAIFNKEDPSTVLPYVLIKKQNSNWSLMQEREALRIESRLRFERMIADEPLDRDASDRVFSLKLLSCQTREQQAMDLTGAKVGVATSGFLSLAFGLLAIPIGALVGTVTHFAKKLSQPQLLPVSLGFVGGEELELSFFKMADRVTYAFAPNSSGLVGRYRELPSKTIGIVSVDTGKEKPILCHFNLKALEPIDARELSLLRDELKEALEQKRMTPQECLEELTTLETQPILNGSVEGRTLLTDLSAACFLELKLGCQAALELLV